MGRATAIATAAAMIETTTVPLSRDQTIEHLAETYWLLRRERDRIVAEMKAAREGMFKALGRRRDEYRSAGWVVRRIRSTQWHLDRKKLEKVLGDLEKYSNAIPVTTLRVDRGIGREGDVR